MRDEIRKAVEESEMVLVGIGGEFSPELPDFPAGELAEWRLSRYYAEIPADSRELGAYRALRDLIGPRPYFVVTLNTDGLIYRSALEPDLIVAPCGDRGKLQCGTHILDAARIRDQLLTEAEEEADSARGGRPPAKPGTEQGSGENAQPEGWRREAELVQKYAVCPQCGKPLRFHTVENPDYLESGYLPQWERYTKWLSCTLNRRLCLLELGVDFTFPQVIRWPFEKTAFYNQKSVLVRVNSRFPQAAKELWERTVSIAETPVDALL